MGKIYTKGGDRGKTSLVTGERVSKSDARVCAYGDMDELISYLGVLRSISPENDGILRRIQQNLMLSSAWVATASDVYRMKLPEESEILWLESQIDRISVELPPMTAFILPAGPTVSSIFQVARTVCRRAERNVTALSDERASICYAAKYLNRLSDLLFVMGRISVISSGEKEDFWLP